MGKNSVFDWLPCPVWDTDWAGALTAARIIREISVCTILFMIRHLFDLELADCG
jgi:hypothetical protein